MLILLSPAKTFDLTSPLATTRHTQPRLLEHTEELVEEMRALSVSDFSRLMDISQDLAALTAERAADFELPFTQANARQAVLAFDGEAYRGLDAPGRFDTRDFTEAQKTLRLLSGLYGVLRPLDLIQPYRLEMGTRLRTDRGRDLYEFWGTTIADLLARDLADSPGADAVVNLASKEYASAVDEAALGAPMIAPRFEDTDARGRRSVVTVYAKHARGDGRVAGPEPRAARVRAEGVRRRRLPLRRGRIHAVGPPVLAEIPGPAVASAEMRCATGAERGMLMP